MDSVNNSKQKSEKDNVIKFTNVIGYNRAEGLMELKNKRIAISASIISIAVLVTIANSKLLSQKESHGRMIASVHETLTSSNSQWYQSLSKKLAKEPQRGLASIGKTPSPMDQLRFGFLEGKYALRFEEGSLAEIEFYKSSDMKPRIIANKEEFLNDYKDLLKLPYNSVEKLTEYNVEGVKEEVYALKGEDKKVMAKAYFGLDQESGRFLSLKIERNTP